MEPIVFMGYPKKGIAGSLSILFYEHELIAFKLNWSSILL
jgi:hypothetical protein